MITIENGLILKGKDMEPLKANLTIQDKEIIEISAHASGGNHIDARGCVVAPGLINSHIHLGDTIAKDIGDGKSLEEIVKPPDGIKHQILAKSSKEDLIKGIKESIWQMVHSGTTSFIDFREGGVEGVEILREAAEDIPIRAVCLGRQDSFLNNNLDVANLEFDVDEILKNSEGIGLSGFGEVPDKNARYIVSACQKKGKISAIHVAENNAVQEDSLHITGQSEVKRAVSAGFKLLIHVTSPLGDDIERIRSSNASVVACPRANGMLSLGIPPLFDMWRAGINLLLGTDNIMFNHPDMFREMEYALKSTRGLYKQYFPPTEILKMATSNAGSALDKKIGVLEEGYLADIMIVEQLSSDPILSLINRTQSKNIKTVITDGTII